MTKDYIKRQFSNFYNEVIKGSFAKSEELNNLNANNINIVSAPQVVYDMTHLSSIHANSIIENGVLTFICPTRDNRRIAQQKINIKDMENGIFKVRVNVTECVGKYYIFLNASKKTGGTLNKPLTNFEQAGVYEAEVDLNYYAVYEDLDVANVNISINNANVNAEGENNYRIVIDKWDILSGGNSELSEYDGQTVAEVLSVINAKVENTNTTSDSNTLIAPNGEVYLAQIENNGSVSYIPKLPSNILYLGNSLLLGWTNRGMASVDVSGDYYYKVNHYLEEKGKTLTTERYKVVDFERFTTDEQVTTWFTEFLSDKMSNDRDLVLIQLGDNVSSSDLTEFTKSCGMLCSYVRENCPNARVAWVDTWWGNTNKNTIIKNACAKYGCIYIHISDLYTSANKSSIGTTYIDSNGVEQTITDQTVANHPSDTGFTAIANRIIETLFT